MDEADEEVDEDDRELSLWRRRLGFRCCAACTSVALMRVGMICMASSSSRSVPVTQLIVTVLVCR